MKTTNDPVNHPNHYTDGPECPHCGEPIECIVVTEDMTFCVGNAIKYLWRAGKKDPARMIEDYEKAAWYVSREIDRLKRKAARDARKLEAAAGEKK